MFRAVVCCLAPPRWWRRRPAVLARALTPVPARAVLAYRQDLDGFGEPALGGWDGFQRINTDTRSGGLVGVFRHGAPECERQIRVGGLDEERKHLIRDENGRVIVKRSGRALAQRGFRVVLPDLFDGRLFELLRVGTV